MGIRSFIHRLTAPSPSSSAPAGDYKLALLVNHELKMGNKVRIYSYEEIFGMPPNTVKISGEVKRPGLYEAVENFRVLDLLFLAGGLKDSAFIENIYFERFDLFRLSNDKRTKNKFSYNRTR